MYARTISANVVPGRVDEAIRVYEEKVVPLMQQQVGYVRGSLFIDRNTNQAMTISIWEDQAAALSTGEGTNYLKEAVSLLSGLVVPKSYHTWELALSDRPN